MCISFFFQKRKHICKAMHLCIKFLGALLFLLSAISEIEGCNEALCVSIVSKCMLIKSCDCDMTNMKNCSCCKDCNSCLSTLYTECCSCVGEYRAVYENQWQ